MPFPGLAPLLPRPYGRSQGSKLLDCSPWSHQCQCPVTGSQGHLGHLPNNEDITVNSWYHH